MTMVVVGLSGLFFFLSVYLTFDYWYQKIWIPMLGIRDETVRLREDLFTGKDPQEVLKDHIWCSSIMAGLVGLLAWPHIYILIPAVVTVFWFSWKIPLAYQKHVVRPSRIKKFTLQLVDALTLMANGMKSGLNVPQALQIVVDEMPKPIREEFGLVLTENKVGLALDKAFENLARRIPTEDVSMFVTSVNILRETGGNVAETFETIVKTIRERLKLQSKISAMTAQGMTSAIIVGALPWGLAVVLYLMDPVMMKPLFVTPLGWLILLAVIGLEVVGFFVILKVVQIKV